MAQLNRRVLIVEDVPETRRALRQQVESAGYDVEEAEDGQAALDLLQTSPYEAMILDRSMPRMDGFELLRVLAQTPPEGGLPAVMMVTSKDGHRDYLKARELGIDTFLGKPWQKAELLERLDRIIDARSSDEEFVELPDEERVRDYTYRGIVGRSSAIRSIIGTIESLRDQRVNVLVQGETGTGKELVVKALHATATESVPTAAKRFVAVDCAAIPENLLEAELFGYERGAFTGAQAAKKGRFELAGSGTLFLDEIGDLPLMLQPKLLRAIGSGEFTRLGGKEAIRVSPRIVAASSVRLEDAVAERRFREDLYHRLNVVTVPVPALRERLDEDLLLLCAHFVAKHAARGQTVTHISARLLDLFGGYSWPGNIRELEHILQSALVSAAGDRLGHAALDATSLRRLSEGLEAAEDDDSDSGPGEADLEAIFDKIPLGRHPWAEIKRAVYETTIRKHLRMAHGNISRAADSMGLARSSVVEKLREFGIEPDDFKGGAR